MDNKYKIYVKARTQDKNGEKPPQPYNVQASVRSPWIVIVLFSRKSLPFSMELDDSQIFFSPKGWNHL